MKYTQHFTLIIIITLVSLLLSSCRSEPKVTDQKDKIVIDSSSKPSNNPAPEITDEVDFPSLEPINQIDQDASLKKMVKDLQKIIKKKSVSRLVNYIDEDIKIGFGAENGRAAFMKHWGLNSTDTDNSEIWQELHAILNLGGVFFNDNSFSMPYVFDHFPENYDVFEFAAITGEHVRMRDQPNLKGEVITSLSYEIVKLASEKATKKEEINGEEYPWVKIIRTNNQTGYVYGKYVRSPIDYRIFLEREENGKWIITTFLAGD